ncbi:NifU family protein [Gordonia sp. NPDC003376]
MLLPAPTDPADPAVIRWRVGPGLIRMDGEVSVSELPGELRALVDAGVLETVRVQPGRVDTRLCIGHDPRTDGPTVRDALFTVLSRPGGWPVTGAGARHPDDAVQAGADAEIADGVRSVLAGEFGGYTASHGGRVELVDVVDGVVTVRMGGTCHGCAAATVTLRQNLAIRLRSLPGFTELRSIG